jgi:hypothetical protein
MANGDQSGTWGTTNNTNLGTLIEEAIAGWESIATGDTDVTLTTNNGSSDQARKAMLKFTGTLTANRNVIVPAVSKIYFIDNACSGSFSLIVKPSAGTGVTVPNGTKTVVYCDGTNVVSAINWLSALTLGTALPVASGGTGGTSQSAARTGLGLGTISTQNANNVSITGGSATGLTSVSATTITGTSDKRLKEEIYPLFGALERVKKLEGVEFSWKSNKKKSVGLIAQDVEEVFPELVHTDGFGFKSIEYGNLVAVLIEAVKELDRKVSG